ncbi:MAG: hypothetical protein B6244_12985 [Candidatus Cloacimonetes bacterium 4572_55]|nr:MAG: hypothetical protein B6244_12985 [Candidatus Cloacimonetes bacterium 4572_55]
MKIHAIFLILFFHGSLVFSADSDIVLNEVMFNPVLSENSGEFLEIYNTGDDPVDLTGWSIGDQNDSDTIIEREGGMILQTGQYGVILDPNYDDTVYEIPENALILQIDGSTFGSGGLSNSTPETIILENTAGDSIALYTYSIDNADGYSDEKRDPIGGDDAENWGNSEILHGTPGFRNSVALSQHDLSITAEDIRFFPSQPQASEPVTISMTIQNQGSEASQSFNILIGYDINFDGEMQENERLTEPIEITESILPADSTEAQWVFETPLLGLYRLIIELDYQLDEDIGDNRASILMPVGELPIAVNEIYYLPLTGEGETEWIELFCRSQLPLNLQDWSIEDSNASPRLITENVFVIQPDQYVILTADSLAFIDRYPDQFSELIQVEEWLSLNNGGDQVVVRPNQSMYADSIAYDSEWGASSGVSLERISVDDASNVPNNWGLSIDADGATPWTKRPMILRTGIPASIRTVLLPGNATRFR